MKIKRLDFNIEYNPVACEDQLLEEVCEDGDYVKYSDIEHLILENEMLRERLRQKEREIDNLNKLGRIQERNLRRFRGDDW